MLVIKHAPIQWGGDMLGVQTPLRKSQVSIEISVDPHFTRKKVGPPPSFGKCCTPAGIFKNYSFPFKKTGTFCQLSLDTPRRKFLDSCIYSYTPTNNKILINIYILIRSQYTCIFFREFKKGIITVRLQDSLPTFIFIQQNFTNILTV